MTARGDGRRLREDDKIPALDDIVGTLLAAGVDCSGRISLCLDTAFAFQDSGLCSGGCPGISESYFHASRKNYRWAID